MDGIPRHARSEAVAGALPDAVWRIISDVTRVGEWSHECRGAQWLGGADGAAPGVRFRGRNKSGPWRWVRPCRLTVVDAPRSLGWRTEGLLRVGDTTEWRIDLEPVDEGTRIVQTYDVVRVTPGFDRLYWLLIKAHRDRSDALVDDLDRLARLAEREAAGSVSG
jgi:polyketide cyclase/dehydrase/lipid transport protein